jgi:hypothetical protein
MPGDVERDTFHDDLGFANVDLQQGRLLLPAEFNEQSAIHHHFLRSFIVDLVGRSWSAGDGFKIGTDGSGSSKIEIEAGRYYVDGILCENKVKCSFESQPFGPTLDDPAKVTAGTPVALYLDCWHRHVSWLNYPPLRDPALGGADSATRIQIAWQVRLLTAAMVTDQLGDAILALNARTSTADAAAKKELDATLKKLMPAEKLTPESCENAKVILDLFDEASPRMAADAKREADNPDPCAIAPDSEYRGRENQLYRVEIHQPGLAGPTGPATFKWSRENASVAFKVIDIVADPTTDKATTKATTHVTLENLGRDHRTGVCEGEWVELVDDDSEFQWHPLTLLQIAKVDAQRRVVTLTGVTEPTVDPGRHALMRRWDHTPDEAGGAIFVKESKSDTDWIELERGVRIQFMPGGLYRKGDYWLIPARVATGDVEWPTDEAGTRLPLEPHGIKHHRATLAIVKKDATGWSVSSQCGCHRTLLCDIA